MEFLIAFVIMIAISFLFRNAIKKAPWVFYLIALLLSGLYIYSRFFAAYDPLIASIMVYPQRGLLGMATFTIVMFIGVFGGNSRIRKWLEPIRAELSLIGSLLIAGHALGYLASYLQSLSPGLLSKPTVVISLAVSLLLLMLLLILGITTLVAVRRRMDSSLWKRIQRLSYFFYGLVFVHLMLMLLPSAMQGTGNSSISLAIYGGVLLVYLIARIRRAVLDKAAHKRAALA